ncbi:MAG: hypothetical protein NT162_00405 [Candidatus Woesebacteria bacterium]|nr:hypothetical protein [Candidatus Woesebacteria bacterium]
MERILMGGIVGFALFTLVSYLLIVLNIPILIIPVTIFAIIIGIRPLIKTLRQIKIKFDWVTILTLLVFIVGIVGQLLVISPSGVFKNGDLVFWSSHGHDVAWHIALMDEINRGYPFQNPVFAGEKLVNYHFFSDIAPAIISKYLPISDLNLYFRILPFIYSLLFGASAYFLTKKITGSRIASIWATVFTYFAGSFGYIIGKGESVFWATQPQSASGNPPQIISDFMVMAVLYFLFKLISEKGGKITFWILVLLIGTLTEFKVYGAIVILGALILAGLWQLLKERKFQILTLAILSGILGALLYVPNSSGTVSFLIFQPWWYIRTMIVEPSRLNLLDWEYRRQTYIYEHNWKRVIFLEGLGLSIFFFGNLGMRFVGLWDALRFAKNTFKNYFNLIFILIIPISVALPLLFLQKGVASNTAQFLQYFLLLAGILAGISTARLLKVIKIPVLQILLSVILIITMVPTQLTLLRDFYGTSDNWHPPFAKISMLELQALNYVKNNTSPDTIILTPAYDQYLSLPGVTPNIWDWSDTGYVAAFSDRRTYLDDHEQVDIMGYEWRQRLAIKEGIFKEKDPNIFLKKFDETKSQILYFPKAYRPLVDLTKTEFTKIYENSEVEIWKTG